MIMDHIGKWLVKKFICGEVNSLLKEYEGSIDTARKTVRVWIDRIRKILSLLESVLSKIDDGELSSDEVKEAADEISATVRNW